MDQHQLYNEMLSLISRGFGPLPDKPGETAESTLKALWHCAAGFPLTVEEAEQKPLGMLDAEKIGHLRELIGQRLRGAPLAHLTKRQSFMGISMLAGPGALVPRKETELIAAAAFNLTGLVIAEKGSALVMDLCTGIGNIALSIARAHPAARIYASDISEEALTLARQNQDHCALQGKVDFRQGDCFAPFEHDDFRGMVDVLICNPPYIASKNVCRMPEEIKRYEPGMAFDGGPFGVSIIYNVINGAPRFLRAGGWLCLEVGLGQGRMLERLLKKNQRFQNVKTVADPKGEIRGIVAEAAGIFMG
ncbi:MAG: peptide chain release factor N(5)-glutamine methyltransferase [Chitinivibrionales bacterium]|nr:peptide chain release factor N(5)-glutamine methyltransferase [Chitinivibrionales bacterium]